MKRKIVRLIGALILLPTSVFGQEVGNYGYLEIPTSARIGALGGTNISVVEPEAALADQNPALLCPEMSGQLSLNYINYVSDIHLGSVSYTGTFLEAGGWQAGIRYVDYGSFAGYDENGVSTGDFSVKDMAFSGSVGYPINDRWNCGATARFLYSSYDSYTALALGVDLGVNYYNEVTGRSVSLTVNHLGGQLKRFEDRHASLPTQINFGITKELEHLPFCLSLTAVSLLDWDTDYLNADGESTHYSNAEQVLNHLIFGLEWLPSEHLYFSAAYNYRSQRQYSGMGGFLRGVSFGGGLHFSKLDIQCSYARYNVADGSLSVGLGYHF